MAEQIECVGGPLDGETEDIGFGNGFLRVVSSKKKMKKPCGATDIFYEQTSHIYTYNPTTNTYEYKGVRK